MTMMTVSAAETQGPVSKWLDNVTSKVAKKEQSVNQKSQAKQAKSILSAVLSNERTASVHCDDPWRSFRPTHPPFALVLEQVSVPASQAALHPVPV